MIIHHSTKRRLLRVRKKLATNISIPRLSVYRTNRHIWAQIIDDKHGKTLAATSSKTLPAKTSTKLAQATLVGKQIAMIALDKKISHVRFDRGAYNYHGRVKSLADAARESGLKF